MIAVCQFSRLRKWFCGQWISFGVFCLILLMLLIGCARLAQSPKNKHTTPEPSQVQQGLADGFSAFSNQDYDSALRIFNKLAETHADLSVRRNALYGLACTRLTLARTLGELEAAMVDWVKWVHSLPEPWIDEDPRMLDLVLHNYRTLHHKMSQKNILEDEQSANDQKQLTRFRTQVKDQKAQLELKEQEIQELQKQIDQLEAIRQETIEKIRQITPAPKKAAPLAP